MKCKDCNKNKKDVRFEGCEETNLCDNCLAIRRENGYK
jgi:hypothetical protein